MKKALSILLVLFLVIQSFAFVGDTNVTNAATLSDGTPKTLRFVYFRFDQNYEGWNLWVWPKDGEGAAYTFASDMPIASAGGKIAKVVDIDVSKFGAAEAGVIVRLNEWEAKDVDSDRFIPLNKTDENGVLTVYLVQSIAKVAYSEADAPLAPKIDKAEFTDLSSIRVDLQAGAPSVGGLEGFKVTENGNDFAIDKVIRGSDGVSYVIKLAKEANAASSYKVVKEGYGDMSVSTSKLYDADFFKKEFTYTGTDLGATYAKDATAFRLWAPTAEKVALNLYAKGDGGAAEKTLDMTKDKNGTWVAKADGDLNGKYYTYSVTVSGNTNEVMDPYARAAGVNGDRGMIIDLTKTNPDGWDKVGYKQMESPTDAVIYEMHVRDTTIDPTSGVKNNAGKYLGFAEKDTKNKDGMLTGISHAKELGITHIHLLPIFDYNSVNEANLEKPQFNWGYDPKNYDVPEGSYATDPYNGEVRIKELKEMVKSIKDEGMGVIMDVVYNHTALSSDSNFNKIVPNYYYRTLPNGKFSNGSGCNNDIASERDMVRKYIVESVVYWAKEYKIDGFRFDLMGLIDIQTMNQIREEVNKIDPSIMIYGEGWKAGATTLPDAQLSLKANISKVPGVAVFNDNTRDGIKGHVFNANQPGFVGGDFTFNDSIRFGIVGGISHPGVNYSAVNYDHIAWAGSPAQTINYIAAHDNLTLYDKFVASTPGLTEDQYKAMTRLGGAMFLTAQGTPFMLAGTDFMRTKGGNGNSYNQPDSVNAINWDQLSQNKDIFEYYKGLISLRAAHPAFRMTTSKDVVDNLAFIDGTKQNVIAYTLSNGARNDNWKTILVAFNAGQEEETITVPVNTTWNVVVDGTKAGTQTLTTVEGNTVKIPPMSAIVAYDSKTATADAKQTSGSAGSTSASSSGSLSTILIIAGAVVVIAILAFFLLRKKKTA